MTILEVPSIPIFITYSFYHIQYFLFFSCQFLSLPCPFRFLSISISRPSSLAWLRRQIERDSVEIHIDTFCLLSFQTHE